MRLQTPPSPPWRGSGAMEPPTTTRKRVWAPVRERSTKLILTSSWRGSPASKTVRVLIKWTETTREKSVTMLMRATMIEERNPSLVCVSVKTWRQSWPNNPSLHWKWFIFSKFCLSTFFSSPLAWLWVIYFVLYFVLQGERDTTNKIFSPSGLWISPFSSLRVNVFFSLQHLFFLDYKKLNFQLIICVRKIWSLKFPDVADGLRLSSLLRGIVWLVPPYCRIPQHTCASAHIIQQHPDRDGHPQQGLGGQPGLRHHRHHRPGVRPVPDDVWSQEDQSDGLHTHLPGLDTDGLRWQYLHHLRQQVSCPRPGGWWLLWYILALKRPPPWWWCWCWFVSGATGQHFTGASGHSHSHSQCKCKCISGCWPDWAMESSPRLST